MSSDKSKGKGDREIKQLFSESSPLIPDAVRWAFRRYRYKPNKLESDGLAQRVRVKLLDDDYAALRSFKHQAPLKSWLQKLVNNFVSRYVQRQRRNVGLEELPPDVLVSELTPEEQAIAEEQEVTWKKKLKAVLPGLTPRQRMLFDLSRRDDLDDTEIAKRMGISTDSVASLRRKMIANQLAILRD